MGKNSLFQSACFLLAGLLAGGCESRRPAATNEKPPAVAPAGAPATALPPDTTDYTAQGRENAAPADTLVRIGAKHYHLRLQATTDSAHRLSYQPVAGGTLATGEADTAAVRGYDVRYTISLRDSSGKQTVFRRQLRKRHFARDVAADVLIPSEATLPVYLGYSPALDALLFTYAFVVPDSDVGGRAVVALDRLGKLRNISSGGDYFSNSADCDPTLSPDGQAALTCSEILRAHGPAVQLNKPAAHLIAARFLTDSALLAVYEYGTWKMVAHPAEPDAPAGAEAMDSPGPGARASAAFNSLELVTTPAQRRAPNAFVLTTSGRVLKSFRYPEWQQELSYYLPRHFVAASRTYYFLNGEKSVFLIPKSNPANVVELPLKQLPKFRAPRRASEVKFSLSTNGPRFDFYVSKANSQQIRYRRPAGGD